MTDVRARRNGVKSASAIAALAGVLLFAYAIRKAGVGEIREGIARVGPYFLLILLLSGVRETVRTLAWMICIEGPHRLPFPEAFAARQTGEAIGNLTPFSLLASEPTKAIYVRHRVPIMTALTATAVENIFYSFTVVVVIALGTVALLATFTVPDGLRIFSLSALALFGALAASGAWILRSRPRLASIAARYAARIGLGGPSMPHRIDQVRAVEDRIYGFFEHHRRRFVPLALLESTFHLSGVAEAYVTLSLVSQTRPVTWLDAFILEAVNRFIIVVFKVIPLRLGVEEAGSGLMTDVLGFGSAAGVTMGIVRKTRVLVWSAVGVLLLLKRGLTPRRVIDETNRNIW